MVEYHGWLVLFSSDSSWTDDEWGNVREVVTQMAKDLTEESGHSTHVGWPAGGGCVVSLNGWTAEIEPVMERLASIFRIAPDSYGELALFEAEEPSLCTARHKLERTLFDTERGQS